MVEKTTSLDLIEITQSGMVGIRLRKEVWLDGQRLSVELHRTVIEPGTDPVAQMAVVNEHLAAMGFSPLAEASIAAIVAVVASQQTP